MSRGEIRIPFNIPHLTGSELEYIQESIRSKNIIGDGVYTRECERLGDAGIQAIFHYIPLHTSPMGPGSDTGGATYP